MHLATDQSTQGPPAREFHEPELCYCSAQFGRGFVLTANLRKTSTHKTHKHVKRIAAWLAKFPTTSGEHTDRQTAELATASDKMRRYIYIYIYI